MPNNLNILILHQLNPSPHPSYSTHPTCMHVSHCIISPPLRFLVHKESSDKYAKNDVHPPRLHLPAEHLSNAPRFRLWNDIYFWNNTAIDDRLMLGKNSRGLTDWWKLRNDRVNWAKVFAKLTHMKHIMNQGPWWQFKTVGHLTNSFRNSEGTIEPRRQFH